MNSGFLSSAAVARPYCGSRPDPDEANRVWDLCVLGSGAAGSIAAAEFARHGRTVLMLEQGAFVDESTTYDDVLRSSEPAYARSSNGCWSLSGYPWSTCNVGGGTVFYGGASFRYREVDFNAERYFPESDLPVGWPYNYDELRTYYDEVESLLGVSGNPADDPCAPPQSVSHLLPPVTRDRSGDILTEAAHLLGLSPFPTPLAITSIARGTREGCNSCGPCIEHRCTTGAKGDAFSVFLKPLLGLRHDAFRLYAGMKAVRLERSSGNEVDCVLALNVDDGSFQRFRARCFVIACNAVQSAGLMLRSADHLSPHGLGNEHDLVGRGMCFKLNEYVEGWWEQKNGPNNETGIISSNSGPFSTFALTDFYLDSNSPNGLGGLIYQAKHGFRYQLHNSQAALRLECLLADRPSWDNRVMLAKDTDSHGINRLVLDYRAHPQDLARLEHTVERACTVLRAAGCSSIHRDPGDFALGSCHLHGTCRGGHDPKYSVVDAWSRVHSIENVYIIDGSFMPFPGGVNPTLTIQAHALRCARHIAETWHSCST